MTNDAQPLLSPMVRALTQHVTLLVYNFINEKAVVIKMPQLHPLSGRFAAF